VERRVRAHEPRARAEDRAQRVGRLVARPALDDAELAGVVDGDVDRAVAALREAADRARRAARDRAEATVDRAHEVAGAEGRPALVRADSVRPLLVGERPGRA